MRTAPLLAIILAVALAGVGLAAPLSTGTGIQTPATDGPQIDGWLVLEKAAGEPVEANVVPATPHHGGGGSVVDAYANGYAHCGIQVAPLDVECKSGSNDGHYGGGTDIRHQLFVPICPSGCFVGTLTSILGANGVTRTFTCDIVWASLASDGAAIAGLDLQDGEQAGTGYQWTCDSSGGIQENVPFQHLCTADEHPSHGELAGFWDCGVTYQT